MSEFLETCKRVVRDLTACTVDAVTGEYLGDCFHGGGLILDMQSANLVVEVNKQLGDEHRERLFSNTPERIISLCWKMTK
jgi:hypothetical protein